MAHEIEAPLALNTRTVAFYLPQFHEIPENDAWWGEGFTEWTKVRPAEPQFAGHYQPHQPHEDIGYYHLLRDDTILHQQAEMAKKYGVSAFCFYFYWFGGKRLLEAPIRKFLDDPSIDQEFCLCWANENWSRRWDGLENALLIAQEHSAEDDIAFISHVAEYMRDPRYIRVGMKPLLLVYRPGLLPDPKATVNRWRRWAHENGLGELYLAYTQSFETVDPADYGFDAAIEFPPNNTGIAPDAELVTGLGENNDLKIYDWRKVAGRSLHYTDPGYQIFRAVCPLWDNTPRRPKDGAVFVNASPSAYKAWLSLAVADTHKRIDDPSERLVFINAWNEWAEGAHLEPDQKHGYAWLEATRQAVDRGHIDNSAPKILVAIHDLHPHGAQYGALNIMKTLRERYGCEVAAISGAHGPLEDAYRQVGSLLVLRKGYVSQSEIDAVISHLTKEGFNHALINSSAAGWLTPHFARNGIRSIGLVHELPGIVRRMRLESGLLSFDEYADHTVFPAKSVQERSAAAAGLSEWRKPVVLPQGLYKPEGMTALSEKEAARLKLCRKLRVKKTSRFAIGVGYGDHRKGIDIFIEWAVAATMRWPDLHFVWVGKIDPEMKPVCDEILKKAGSAKRHVHFPGFAEDTQDYYLAADFYALSSREDPFPSTALEAFNSGTPVVMVNGAGGIQDLNADRIVTIAASASAEDFMEAVSPLVDQSQQRLSLGVRARGIMQERFGFTSYVGSLTDLLGCGPPSVSVVVPNYNYADYLEQRLESITQQTISPREIIFLDDASTDDSIQRAQQILRDCPINVRIVQNQINSGSVFSQWRKGVELARHDLVWIAEADDWADATFLERTARSFSREDIVLSFAQSCPVSADGKILAPDYHEYVRDVSPVRWTCSFVNDGIEEMRNGMSVKNTIPNVSAVVFRKKQLLDVLQKDEAAIKALRVAGDWRVYAGVLKQGAMAFDARSLNYHRRHDDSVTISRFGLEELSEIAQMQAYVAKEFQVSTEMRNKAQLYLKNLVAHFSLHERFSDAEISAAFEGRS